MDNRYVIGEFLNNKYPIWHTKEGRIITESLNKSDSLLIKTALNCYDFVANLMKLS